MPIRYIDLVSSVTATLPPLPIAELGLPVLTPLRKPLSEARVMILTSAGVHRVDEPPFAPVNDLTSRRLPHVTPAEQLRPSHPSPVRRPGEEDIEVVYPYRRLAELAQDGFVGSVAPFHLSMLGAIKRLRALVTEMAPAMAADAKAAGADVVLLVPL